MRESDADTKERLSNEQIDDLEELKRVIEGIPGSPLSGLKALYVRLDEQLKAQSVSNQMRDVVVNQILRETQTAKTDITVVKELLRSHQVPSAIWLVMGMALAVVSLMGLIWVNERVQIKKPQLEILSSATP